MKFDNIIYNEFAHNMKKQGWYRDCLCIDETFIDSVTCYSLDKGCDGCIVNIVSPKKVEYL